MGEGAISSEDRVARNFKVSRAGEIYSFLEKHQIVLIGGKSRVQHDGIKKVPPEFHWRKRWEFRWLGFDGEGFAASLLDVQHLKGLVCR